MKNFTKFLGGNRSGILKVLLVVVAMVWGGSIYSQTDIFSETFDGVNSWTTVGNFAVGAPVSGNTVTTTRSGSNILGTVLNGNYANGLAETNNYAISAPINCTGYHTITLKYYSYSLWEAANCSYDFGGVYYSTDNGSTWSSIAETVCATESAYTLHTVNLTNAIDKSQVLLKFTMKSDGAPNNTGWNIDDITVTGTAFTNYYSKSTGNLNILSNWGTNTDGSGTAPLNFTSNYCSYNIRNNATPTIGAAWTISGTNSKVIVGDGTNACNFTIPSTYAVTGTVDASASGTLTIQNATNPTLGTLSSGSTVDYNAAGNQIIVNTTYQNLTLSSSGIKTMTSVTTVSGNLSMSGTATTAGCVLTSIGGNLAIGGTANTLTTAANLAITGNVTVANGSTFAVGAFTLSVTGTTTIGGGTSGIISFSSPTNPNKTFTGLVTINAGATWSEAAVITPIFQGGITNSGTFTSSTGVHTFNTNNQTLTGTITIPSVTVTGVTVTNNGTLTVSTALAGTGGLTQGDNAILNLTGTTTPSSITTLTTTATGNTVNYNASAAQTLASNTSYVNLQITGGGSFAKTMAGNITVSGTLSIAASTTLDFGATARTLTLSGTGTSNLVNSGIILMTGGTSLAHTLKTASSTSIGTRGTITMESGNIIEYYASGDQTIENITYQSLTLSGSGVKTMTSVTTVSGNLTMSGTATTSGCVLTSIGGNLNLSGTSNTLTTGAGLTVTGTTTVASGCTLTLGNFAFTATGATSITGTINTATGNTGTRTFTGAVTVNANGVWDLSGQNPATSFAGGITHNGTTFNNGSGAAAFSASQSLAGSSDMTFGGGVTPAVNTLTNNNTGTVTIAGVLTLTGNFTQGTNSILSLTASGNPFSGAATFNANTNANTVNYACTGNQTVKAVTYSNLILSGSGVKTMTSVATVSGNLTMSTTTPGTTTTTTATAANFAIGGNLTIGNGCTFATASTYTLGVTGTTSVTGTFTLGSSGTHTHTGNVTINSGGVWNASGNPAVSLAGNLIHNGTTFTSGSGVYTFTASKTLGGSTTPLTLQSLTISANVTVTAGSDITINTGSLTTNVTSGILDMNTYVLAGTGTFTNNGTIKTANTSATPIPASKAWAGTVEFTSASSQTIPTSTSFTNLKITGGGEKTMSNSFTASGVLTLTSGLLTTGSYLITLSSTAVGAVSGGSTSSYVNGSLKRSFTGTTNYVFPVGAGGIYYPLTLNSVSGTAAEVVAYNSGSGGTYASGTVSGTEYWKVIYTSVTSQLIKLDRQIAINNMTLVGYASSANGAYTALTTAAPSGTSITATAALNAGSNTYYLAMLAAQANIQINSASSDATLTGVTLCKQLGGTSTSTFTVSGTNIASSILLTAPTNYEISSDNTTFSSSVTLTTTNGTIAATTIYVRLKSSLSVGTYNSESLTVTSTGATQRTVTVSGTVYNGVSYVSTTGTDNTSNGTSTGVNAYRTLTYAISQSPTCGCQINVGAGTWGTGITDDNITLSTSNISIIGAGKLLTIFDGNAMSDGAEERFMTISGSATNITISDMTIQDMDISGNGAGFNITTTGSVTLQDLIIDNCDLSSDDDLGGAVYVSSSSTATIDRCIFRNNNTYNNSGSAGTCVYNAGTTTLKNCLLYDNTVGYTTNNMSTGHVHSVSNTLNVYNCTFTENTDATASYSYLGDIYVGAGTATITNCILYNNNGIDNVSRAGGTATISYSLYDDGTGGTVTESTGNITNSDVDPLFTDASADDFTITAISPARESGTSVAMPTVDLLEVNRGEAISGTGSTYDMGCYENKCTASSGPFYVNNNSIVDGDVYTTAIGNDVNNITGSSSLPFATLKKAINQCGCAGGTTIYVDAGTFSDDNLTLSTVAASGNNFLIKGAGKTLTVFDCAADANYTERFMSITINGTNITISDLTVKDADISGNGAGFNRFGCLLRVIWSFNSCCLASSLISPSSNSSSKS